MLTAQKLSDFKWKHRILLLMDAQKDIPSRTRQLKLFNARMKAVKERDLLLFTFTGDSVLDLQGKLTGLDPKDIPQKSFQGVILIGKDGGEKYRSGYPVDPQEIFDRIDAMPMRRTEIRSRKKPD